jgi:hypothetical protein
MKNILLLCIALLLVVAGFQQAAAQEKDQNVTISWSGAALVLTPQSPYIQPGGATVTFVNKCPFSLVIRIKDSAGAVLATSPSLSNGQTWAYQLPKGPVDQFCCTYTAPKGADVEQCFDLSGGEPAPTLTQWGLISLLGLILASGVIVAIRKRTAVAQ